MFVQVSGFGDTHFEDALNAVRDITPEDIRELAGKHLCKEKLKEVISGKKMS
jgi:predicted Zn-dependent peptidase